MGPNQQHEQVCTEVVHNNGAGHENAHGADVMDTILFSNVINFIIVIAFIIWLCRKFNLFGFVTTVKDEILSTIQKLKQEKTIKKNQLEETKHKVKNLNQEVTKILDDGEEVANSISERIVKDAEEEAVAMQKKAHAILESEKQSISNEVAKDVTNAAFVIAEEHIKDAIDDNLHQKYINEFIDTIDNLKV